MIPYDVKPRFKGTPTECREDLTTDEQAAIRYSVRMWLLQERAKMSFQEASVYLRYERPKALEDFDEKWHLSDSEINIIMKSAKEKFEKASEYTDVFMGYGRFSDDVIYDKLGRRKNLDRYYKGPK